MIKATAVITATTLNQGNRYSEVQAFATLLMGRKPMWKLHIKDMAFNFYPNQHHIIEDGLWQLSMYLDIPYDNYSSDLNDNPPDDLENEFGAEICDEYRSDLGNYLSRNEVFYTIILNDELLNNKTYELLDELTKAGALISIQKNSLIKLITL